MDNDTFTAVPGVGVGHWTDEEGVTGVTVMSFPEPNVAVVDVRGGAPGTRETNAFDPAIKPVTLNALVFSGGSAFGLAAADGVMAEIEKEGRGALTPAGPVPIVPAAIVYDLMVGESSMRPDAEAGAAAYRAVSEDPVEHGSVGAGTGTTVAGWRGFEHLMKGGVGSKSFAVGDAVLAALVVVNAVGDVFTLEGEPLTGGPHASLDFAAAAREFENTTLIAVATNAMVERGELRRFAVRAHDALGACIRPSHTRFDGDVAFVVSCGEVDADVDALGQAAFVAVGRAIEIAVRSAKALGGVPSVGEKP